MSFGSILYTLLIRPLQLFFEVLFVFANRMTENPGLSIIALSLAMNFLVLPLYRRADAIQEEERLTENRLHKGVAHIKKTFKGDERMMILQTFYRQNNYKPTDVFKGSVSLFLEIPFFIAAYQFLSHLELLQGVSFGIISDLGAADALLNIAGHPVNLLPIVMTGVNLISCIIFTKGYPLKTKIQLYSMAVFFFFFLYSSPAGLVFYWTLNNIFSLVKTIFYKLKNPKKVLTVMFGIIGAVIVLFAAAFYQTDNIGFRIFVAAIGIICLCPLLITVLKKKITFKKKLPVIPSSPKVFWASAIYLIILTGLLIPSAVLKASPQEFCDVNYFLHPDWYIVSALCLAIGTFAVWFGVFYWLAGRTRKVWFDMGMAAACIVATVDYLLFGRNLGLINSSLQYENGLTFSAGELWLNLAAVALIIILVLVLYRFIRKFMAQILLIAGAAFVVMGVLNIFSINSSVESTEAQAAENEANQPSFTLSKTGKNVIVFMLDRGMNEYLPYLINEKPELREMFSGFTCYENTLSFGAYTNFGTPALYGGYEYTPAEINERDDESLVSKQNEALKVMPVLFDENGYNVTVCDPSYANYQYVPDLSIYDDYPDIRTYITLGKFADKETRQAKIEDNERNFFCYSLMKIVPLALQSTLYEDGHYNSGSQSAAVPGNQTIIDNTHAEGISSAFDNAYSVLTNLSEMTQITDDDSNNFLMMSNDSTHEPSMLQEGDYTEARYVDNTEYEEENADRFTVDGQTLHMDESTQIVHYQANMASLLAIGNWMNYLKENGVYDNTRIIIVSDHGRNTAQLDSMILSEDNSVEDLEYYYPLLMVKDFNSTEFTESDEFMTNADVPTLATEGLIEDPVNPFTGKSINNDEKTAHDQYVLGSENWSTSENSGNQFLPGEWFSVHDDVRDKDNWTVLQKDSTSPFEDTE